MARPSKSKLLITQEQYEWMLREIGQRAQMASEGDFRKALKRDFAEFDERLSTPPEVEPATGMLILNTNRNDLRILERLLTESIKLLADEIVPGYTERMTQKPEEAARYGKYRDAAESRQRMLESLFALVTRSL